ncbi:MAG TPA: hypothetical protein VF719_12085, partial [Abditibacteriaceae bacterium]
MSNKILFESLSELSSEQNKQVDAQAKAFLKNYDENKYGILKIDPATVTAIIEAVGVIASVISFFKGTGGSYEEIKSHLNDIGRRLERAERALVALNAAFIEHRKETFEVPLYGAIR